MHMSISAEYEWSALLEQSDIEYIRTPIEIEQSNKSEVIEVSYDFEQSDARQFLLTRPSVADISSCA